MSLPIQMIHIHYHGKYLKLLDSDDQTPLYSVRVSRETPQMEMVRVKPNDAAAPEDTTSPQPTHDADSTTSSCTAAFKALSLGVKMHIRGKKVRLERSNAFTRTYTFQSLGTESRLAWEADGTLTGDFRLVDDRGHRVLARFRNKLFSNSEVGSFEIVGDVSDALKDEILISGLSVLVMVQSLNLATMVLLGASA